MVGLLALLVTGVLAGPASGAVGDGEVRRMAVSVQVGSDDILAVTEEITFAFDGTGHGIERWIPLEYPYDSRHVRVIRIQDVEVSSPTGAPADLLSEESDGALLLRIGNPNQVVSGAQTYLIEYTVTGAMTPDGELDHLAWNATGTQWRDGIAQAQVRVEARVITTVRCVAGTSEQSRDLQPTQRTATTAVCDTDRALSPGTGLAVVVDVPAGAAPAPAPQLRRTGVGGWLALPATLTALGVLLLGLVGIGLVAWQHGRDRRFAGEIPGLEPPAGAERREEMLPWAGERQVAVSFTPPAGLHPGEVGTLLDERANALDVTATILDLAQRGYLAVGRHDQRSRAWASQWGITLLSRDPRLGPDELRPYELLLLEALSRAARWIDGWPVIALGELGAGFGDRLPAIQQALYADVVQRGWYRRPPDQTRSDWTVVGIALGGLAALATTVLAFLGAWWQVGVAGILVGLALVWAARRMPARTGAGTAARVQALGFRQYLVTAEADQIRFEEQAKELSKALPWAVVFGVTAHWSTVLTDLTARFPQALEPLSRPDLPLLVQGLGDLPRLLRDLDGFTVHASHAIGRSGEQAGVDAFGWGGSVLELVGEVVVGGLGGGGGGGW